MYHASRYGFVAFVIIVGVLIARPYRRLPPESSPPEGVQEQQDEITLHDPTPPPMSPISRDAQPIETRDPLAETAARPVAEKKLTHSPAETHSSSAFASSIVLPPITDRAMGQDSDKLISPNAQKKLRPLTPVGQHGGNRIRRRVKSHRIVDGDSLRALAQKYLGSEDRSLEIFELNRDVLLSPEVLPLGREILIPVEIAAER